MPGVEQLNEVQLRKFHLLISQKLSHIPNFIRSSDTETDTIMFCTHILVSYQLINKEKFCVSN